MPVEDTNDVKSDDVLLLPGNTTTIRWSNDSIVPQHLLGAFGVLYGYNVDISLYLLNFTLNSSRNYEFIGKLASDVSNTGMHEITVPLFINNNRSYAIGVIGISLSSNYSSNNTIAIQLLKGASKFGLVYIGNTSNSSGLCSSWHMSKNSESEYNGALLNTLPQCPPERTGEELLNRLPPCPPTRDCAENDLGFREDKFLLSFFHPNASICFRQASFTRYIVA